MTTATIPVCSIWLSRLFPTVSMLRWFLFYISSSLHIILITAMPTIFIYSRNSTKTQSRSRGVCWNILQNWRISWSSRRRCLPHRRPELASFIRGWFSIQVGRWFPLASRQLWLECTRYWVWMGGWGHFCYGCRIWGWDMMNSFILRCWLFSFVIQNVVISWYSHTLFHDDFDYSAAPNCHFRLINIKEHKVKQ